MSDENLNLNKKFIKRGEVNIWKVPTHKGGGRGEAKYVRMRTRGRGSNFGRIRAYVLCA